MAERAVATAKSSETKQICPHSCNQKLDFNSSGSSSDRMLQLQRTAGNRAVQKLVKSRALQAKLRIGQPTDIYEQEADRVAEQVMRTPEPMAVSSGTLSIQRTCPRCEEEKLRRQSIKEEEEDEPLQTKEMSGQNAEAIHNIESRIDAIKGGGQQLSESERAFFEPRFGRDFSQVRVHTDAKAAESARAVNARAFTMGQDMVFGTGQYVPETNDGKTLMAHELTHVVQQSNITSSIQRRQEPGTPRSPASTVPPPTGAPRPKEKRSPKEVVVVDFGVNRNIVNWRECISHIGEIEAESVDQMVRDVRARVGDPAQNCISKLVLDGHGSPGDISVGAGTGWVEGRNISAGNFRPSLVQLRPYFCDGASVVLLACTVGRGATGMRFIQSLADFWQVNIAAPTGEVDGFGIMGVWVWGIPGQVLPSDTALFVDQIVRILDETTYGDDECMIFDLLEDGKNRGLLDNIRAELVRQGRWDSLQSDLRDEDVDRYNRLFLPPTIK